MNKKRRIRIGVFVISIILVNYFCISMLLQFNKSYASSSIAEADLYSKGECGDLITYKGRTIRATYVVYQKDGVEYPAYCINQDKPGVGENGSYTVYVDRMMNDARIWRAITNGFPYESAAGLGCENDKQAFFATKMAIYSILYNFDMDEFGYIGNSGKRVYDAIFFLRNLGLNGSQIKVSNNLTIKPKENTWQIDSLDPTYLSKTYRVTGLGHLKDYTITIDGTLPEGSKIVDEQNEERQEFKPEEQFKLIIPMGKIQKTQEFKISAEAEVKTKAVFIGVANDSALQDYALTSAGYEKGKGVLQEKCEKNTASITIVKQDIETKQPLVNAEFTLYDADKKEIQTNLKTKEDGKILIEDLLPGTYYIKETTPPDGYCLYEDWIEVKLGLNEIFTVIVNDSKEGKTEVSYIKNTLEVKQVEEKQIEEKKIEKTETRITKLPKTGM